MDGLSDFSRSFADALFAAVPELRDNARAERGLLLIDFEPGPERQDCAFWISSDNEEITVGFGMFHTHFFWPPPNPWPENDPIKFIQSLMADETLIEDRKLDGKWSGSSILAATEEPDLRGMKPGSVIYIRSWSGARDRVISGRSECVDQVGGAARVAHGAAGDFYVADRQCLLCTLPLHAAPELMGYFDAPEGPAGSTCFFDRQPSTAAEVDAAIRAIETSCCGALRYGGNDPTILGKLAALGLADRCDATDKRHRGGV